MFLNVLRKFRVSPILDIPVTVPRSGDGCGSLSDPPEPLESALKVAPSLGSLQILGFHPQTTDKRPTKTAILGGGILPCLT
ncbi:hypothetical protein HRE53_27330 (plasmid) [Acaryochloris sp. 'Moss Beach']|uniref:hypothetical protein n=1 Tax=Acaryochloris sp. 'Moss Beach' TaxID=2740837 RepID=UPI001F18B110|nr:hypothetical protein [Acaryochloris sp. 'Moss Beach']UJB72310.1 hypothetical protein HRE53_27330 [Acaryochloris sp. 'Moss Beach']